METNDRILWTGLWILRCHKRQGVYWPTDRLLQCNEWFLAGLASGSTGCVEVARDGCLFAWNFWVTRSTVLRVGAWERLDQTRRCRRIRDSFLAYRLKIPLAINRGLHYSFLKVTFCGPIKFDEGEICPTGIRVVCGMKFFRNRDRDT